MPWTSISKPGAQTYTTVNPMGKETYDQTSLTYDSADTYYDGVNPLQWTDVAKPSPFVTVVAGMATGLITPPTYSTRQVSDRWNKVPKPN